MDPHSLLPIDERDRAFIDFIFSEGVERYRDLPWRNLDDPYAVLVSEVMLQQTQVTRVLGKWTDWMKRYPTIDALAAADVSDVLNSWQGLGYNRRALALKRTANACSEEGGTLPSSYDELLSYPGIGPATAAGVRAFAFNQPGVYLETNVRTVVLHEYFPDQYDVSDKQIIPIVERTCSVDDPRAWYYALLDYGAYLKTILPNPSRRSKHHTKQSEFEGSKRQKRAELLRIVLASDGIDVARAKRALDDFERARKRPEVSISTVEALLEELAAEGFFLSDEGVFSPNNDA